jgi:hypothetical protein
MPAASGAGSSLFRAPLVLSNLAEVTEIGPTRDAVQMFPELSAKQMSFRTIIAQCEMHAINWLKLAELHILSDNES